MDPVIPPFREKSKWPLVRVLALVAAITAALVTPVFLLKAWLGRHPAKLDVLVTMCNSGALKPDAQGEIVLPANLADRTIDRRVHSGTLGGTPVLVFVSTRLRGADFRGWMYATGPVPTGYAMYMVSPGFTSDFDISPSSQANWYFLDRRMD